MNRRILDLKAWRLIVPFLRVILFISLNLAILLVTTGPAREPQEDFIDFLVGISEHEPDTAEYELAELIKNDLWESFFQTELISMNSSGPFKILEDNPKLDFYIVVDVIEEDTRSYAATIYSPHISDPRPFDSGSQRGLSSVVINYISSQARGVINSRIATSTPFSNGSEDEVIISDQVALYSQARYQFDIRDYQSSIETLNELLLNEPVNWRVHYSLYRNYNELGNRVKQWEHIQAGLEIDPENEHLLMSKANYYFQAKEYERAIPIYHSIVNSTQNGPAARYNLSLGYERLGDINQAIEVLDNPSGNWGTLDVKIQNQLFNLQEQQRVIQIRNIAVGLILLIIITILVYTVIKRQGWNLQKEIRFIGDIVFGDKTEGDVIKVGDISDIKGVAIGQSSSVSVEESTPDPLQSERTGNQD